MKNNLRNGAIIGIIIAGIGIGGGIFIANNKSIDIPQIKQQETANQETNKSEDKKEDTKTNNKEDKTEDKSEDTKSKSKDNNTKSKEKLTTSNNKAVTESDNQKVACAICGKKDYIDNMWITENHYECNNCVNKCPYCGKQMQEVYPSNYYCTNPSCMNCIDDYDRQKYNPANPGDNTSIEDAGDYDPEPWYDPENNSQWFGTD